MLVNFEALNKSQIITEFGSSRVAEELDTKAKNMRNLIGRVHSLRLLGSAALNACYVANGCGDLYYEYGIHIWDMAAACLIAKEAGCIVCDPENGGPLNMLNRRIMIAASQQLIDEVIPLVQTVFYPSD
jgi:myo-inositol-1(or 4)-monophosphatase